MPLIPSGSRGLPLRVPGVGLLAGLHKGLDNLCQCPGKRQQLSVTANNLQAMFGGPQV